MFELRGLSLKQTWLIEVQAHQWFTSTSRGHFRVFSAPCPLTPEMKRLIDYITVIISFLSFSMGESLVNGLLHSESTTVQILPSHSQHVEAPRQALHRIANSSEHPHTTRPALDVLTQPTKRDKLGLAICLWASIYLILVARATQVLIELRERPECRVAQKALVHVPIPRELRRPRRRRERWFVPTQGPGE
jgi:hypothetical protein